MNSVAVGVYLWTLRDLRGFSRKQLAGLLKTSRSQVERVDYAKGETRTSLLLQYAKEVGADLNELTELLLNEEATVEYARQLAETRAKLARMTPEERDSTRQRAAALISELEQDPRKLDQWLGYGDRLREE